MASVRRPYISGVYTYWFKSHVWRQGISRWTTQIMLLSILIPAVWFRPVMRKQLLTWRISNSTWNSSVLKKEKLTTLMSVVRFFGHEIQTKRPTEWLFGKWENTLRSFRHYARESAGYMVSWPIFDNIGRAHQKRWPSRLKYAVLSNNHPPL